MLQGGHRLYNIVKARFGGRNTVVIFRQILHFARQHGTQTGKHRHHTPRHGLKDLTRRMDITWQ